MGIGDRMIVPLILVGALTGLYWSGLSLLNSKPGWAQSRSQPGAQRRSPPTAQAPQPQSRSNCRTLQNAAFVYQGPAMTSPKVWSLNAGEEVLLADRSPRNGLIAVRFRGDQGMQVGYVETRNLLNRCTNSSGMITQKPPTNGNSGSNTATATDIGSNNRCRRVGVTGGVYIWPEPEFGPQFRAILPVNSALALAEPISVRRDDRGYLWARVLEPVPGWVVVADRAGQLLREC